MVQISLSILLLVLGTAGCSHRERRHVRNDLHHAGQEIREALREASHELKRATQEVREEARRAHIELRDELRKAARERDGWKWRRRAHRDSEREWAH